MYYFAAENQNNVTAVAFTVHIRSAGAKGYVKAEEDKVIPYNEIVVNLGKSFDGRKSVFTCPIKGVYAFWFTFRHGKAFNQYPRIAQLMLNDEVITEVECVSSYDQPMDMMCGNSAIIKCPASGKVFVKASRYSLLIPPSSRHSNIFTGFLLNT